MLSELNPCPACGALPCDWVNNPHITSPAAPNFNECADGDEWVDECHFSPTGFAVWRCEGDRKFCTCKPATQADDAEWDAAIERLEQSTSRLSGELHAAIATHAGDDALVEELARAICRAWVYCDLDKSYGQWRNSKKSQRMAETRAVLPIIYRREATAFEQGLAIGKSDAKGNYDAGEAKGRAETIADAIAAQPSTDYDVIGAYERGHMRGVADFVEALCAIERGQHERPKP